MTNFAKKLEEASKEELYEWTNTLNPNYTVLTSDELTRRSLSGLQEKIDKLDNSTTKFSIVLAFFAFVQIIIMIAQFIFDMQTSGRLTSSIIALIFIVICIVSAFIWLLKVLKK